MASKFIIDDALISDMLNFSAKPAPTYRQAEDASMRGLESLLIPDAPGVPEGEAYYPQTAVSGQSFLDKLPFFTDTSKIDLSKAPGDRGRFDITEKNIKELGNAFKGIMDMHSEGLKQIDEDFADDPIAKNALKALGYLSTGTNLAITAGFSPFTVGTAYVGDLIANVTGDETTGRQLFRDLNTFLIGKGGEAPVTIKIPSKKGVVNATVNKDGSINVGEKTYGGDLNLNRAQFMELVRRETFGSAGRETGNLNLMPLREDGLPSPTVQKTEIPKVSNVIKDIQTKAKDIAPDPKAKDLTLDNIDPKDVTDNSYNPAVLIPKFSTEKQTGDKVLNENKTAPALTKNFDASTAYGFPGQWWDFKTNQSLNNKSFMSGTITIDPETLLPSTQFNNEIKGNYDIKIQGRTKDPDLDGTVVTVNKLGGTRFKILESPNKDLIGKPLQDKQGLLAITRGNSARNKTAAGGGKFKITGTDHIYTMKFNSTTPLKLGAFPAVQDNPRLVGVTVDDIFVGDVGMTIQVGGSKGKIHPVYNEVLTTPPGTYKKMEEAGFDPYKKENSIAEYQKYLELQSKPVVEPKYHPNDVVFSRMIRPVLTKDLLKPQYLKRLKEDSDISCGHCYHAAEAIYHKWGKFNGFTSKYLTSKDFPEGLPQGDTHWFLQNNKTGEIIDPTSQQFGDIPIPYEKGTGAGFQTKEPSKPAKDILERIGTDKVIKTPSGVVLDFANEKGIEIEGAELSDWLRTHNYDLEYNSPERKILGDLKNTTGNDPRFLVGFETKEGNRGYITGYGTNKNVGFVEYIANLGTETKVGGEAPSPLKPSELKEIINELRKHYGFRQFAGDRITGIRKQNRDNQDSTFDRSQDLFAITPKPKSGVDLMINPNFASIGKTGNISLRDVFDFLDDVPKRDLKNPVERKQMINEAFDEIVYMKQQAVSGEGWYQQDVKKALKIVEKILPVVKERPILKDFLLFLTGISSALTPVGSDFKIGIQMIKSFAETGEIPLRNPFESYNEKSDAVKKGLAKVGDPKKWNRNAQNLEKQITFVNNFIKDQGLDAFMKFLFANVNKDGSPRTRRDLTPLRKKYANMEPLSGKLDEKIFGFQNFGPKVGPFLANISGVTSLNVVDLWNSRGMNRRTGNMFIRDKNGKILSFADTPRTETERELWNGFMDELAERSNLSVDDTQAILWYFEQLLYTHLGVKSEPKSYADVAKKFLEEAEKEANDSDGGVRQSDGSKNKPTVPKKKQGGSISIPQRRSLVNDGLVDINTIIGKLNYGN